MANPSNHGSAVIRLACDPKFFPNSDGSETVRVTGYAENDFANKAGEVTSEKLSFERYLPNGKRGAFGHMHTGDLVGFGYRLATSDYTNAQGERVYGQGNLAIINSVKLYSSKRESDTRAAEQQQSAKQQESQTKQVEQTKQQQNQAPQQQQRPQEAQSVSQAPQQQTSSQPQPNVQQQSQAPQQQQQQASQQPQMPQQGLQPVNPAIAQQIIAQQQHNPNAPININQIARDLGQQPPMPPQQAQQQPPQVQQQPQQQQQQGQPQQQAPVGLIGYPDIFSPKPPAAQSATPQQAQPQPQMQPQAPVQQQLQQPNLPPQIPQQAPQPQQQAPAQQPQQQPQQPQNQPGANELPYGMGGVQQNPSMAARQEYNSTYSETLNANHTSSPKGGFSADHDDIPF